MATANSYHMSWETTIGQRDAFIVHGLARMGCKHVTCLMIHTSTLAFHVHAVIYSFCETTHRYCGDPHPSLDKFASVNLIGGKKG